MFIRTNGNSCYRALNWIYLYDADVFLQFSILIRILDLISDPNQSRDSYILINLDILSIREVFIRTNGNSCYRALNWIYLYDADVFLQFSILIRILDLISDPNQSRDSYILIKLDTLSIREVFIRTNGNSCYRALNWIYLYDADVFLQFSILIRILDLISDPNQSRDSYILINLNILSIREVFIRTNGNSCYRALNWIYLYDADVFLQFSILIRILDLISDPNQSRDSYILIKLDTLSIREVFIRTNGNSCYRALNWIYLYDADVFLQFSILIRILYLISDPNQSRDSYILIKLDTLSIREVFIRTNGNSCYRALNWIYLYDADVFLQFSILIRILDLISDPNQSRDSYILINLDILSIREVFIRTNGNSCYRALNWIYLYDADVFLQFSILIRILDLISDPNQSRDSYILIKLDTLSIREVFIRTNGNSCYRALNWIYLYDADVFLQFSILIRILYHISDPNQSRDSYILIKLDTLSIREVFIRTNGNSCYRALNWIYLYDADVFLQFSILIRILDLISDPNQSRDSYILIKLDTLSIREVFIRTNGNSCYRALNWIYLYDADVFLQFSILIRILDLISDPNQSRD